MARRLAAGGGRRGTLMRGVRRVLWILLVLALALAAATAYFFVHAGGWLNHPDAPIKADAIVVLSGRFERTMYAADLYRDGYAPVVVLSDAVADEGSAKLAALGIRLPSGEEIQRQILRAKGVPQEKIEMLGPLARSTADEAKTIAERYGQPGRRILVVTSPSHVLRARLIISRALEGRGATLAVCATPYEELPDRWWKSQDAARDVLLEWSKLAFYLLGGRYSARD
ncbi:MAG TPA: YdcF family protein [Burkholderiales bacterium]|nr:YdcF family protein [Burkholderiales bacterium]